MKILFTISLMLLLGSIALTAQAVEQGSSQGGGRAGMEGLSGKNQAGTLNYEQPQPHVCPVSLRAQHAPDGGMLKVSAGGPKKAASKGQGQGLHLTITGPSRRQITQATVIVRSLTSHGVLTPAMSNHDSTPPTAKTMDVKFTAGEKDTAFADLWVPGLTAVQAIDIKSVVYADGSSWNLTSGMTCRTVPDPLMLVGSR